MTRLLASKGCKMRKKYSNIQNNSKLLVNRIFIIIKNTGRTSAQHDSINDDKLHRK